MAASSTRTCPALVRKSASEAERVLGTIGFRGQPFLINFKLPRGKGGRRLDQGVHHVQLPPDTPYAQLLRLMSNLLSRLQTALGPSGRWPDTGHLVAIERDATALSKAAHKALRHINSICAQVRAAGVTGKRLGYAATLNDLECDAMEVREKSAAVVQLATTYASFVRATNTKPRARLHRQLQSFNKDMKSLCIFVGFDLCGAPRKLQF